MPEVINKAQQAYLNIVRMMSHNELDGEQIYSFLVNNPDMWEAVYPTIVGPFDLLPLRDLDKGLINIDRIYFKVGIAERQWMTQAIEEIFKADYITTLPCKDANKLMGISEDIDDTFVICAWWD